MKRKKKPFPATPSTHTVSGQSETAADMVNRYGTYEIQPTADTDDEFPQIAQGLPKKGSSHGGFDV